LRYLPPGAPLIVALRPTALLSHAEGARTLEALGPLGDLVRTRLPAITGVDLANMAQVWIALVDRAPNPPSAAIVVRANSILSESSLLNRWGNPAREAKSTAGVFRNADWAYYLAPGGDERLLAVMSPDCLQDVLDGGTEPPLFRPEVERLVRSSDADRMVNILFTPDFLLMPGGSLLSGEARQLQPALAEFLGSEVKAGLLSCHLDGPSLFAELAVAGTLELPPSTVVKMLQNRLHAARLRIEERSRTMSADPYSGKVLFRFPQMLAELEKHIRTATIDRQVTLRCYLPDRAAHNLALAAQLAIEGVSDAPPVVAAAPQNALSIEQRLKQVTSLSFPLENLENAIATLGGEIGVEIRILGSDLQLEGITRNQQFQDLNEVDKPAEQILRQILIKARPDGKLVYVLGKDGERDIVYITVRSKAQERGRLPPELAP
jgi:hypothetical protein